MWLLNYRPYWIQMMEIIFLWWKYFMCEKYFKNLTCNSVISFSAILGSDGLVWADPPDPLWPPEWLVAGQEECLVAPQKAAAELPPMSIMLEPWTCIMLALLSQHFLTLRSFSPSRLTPGLTGVEPENWILSDSDSDSRNWPGSALSPNTLSLSWFVFSNHGYHWEDWRF